VRDVLLTTNHSFWCWFGQRSGSGNFFYGILAFAGYGQLQQFCVQLYG